MEWRLRTLELEELRRLYTDELVDTFPDAELKPFRSMENLISKGRYDPQGLFEGDLLLGYALLWTDESGYALLDYLGVTAARRNGGVGAKLLRMLEEYGAKYKGILVESEAPGDPAGEDYALRLRRLGFYDRCGLRRLGYDCAMYGVHYCTLFLPIGGVMPPEEEILAAHQAIYRKQGSPENYKRYIQLPLAPGEAVQPLVPWTV